MSKQRNNGATGLVLLVFVVALILVGSMVYFLLSDDSSGKRIEGAVPGQATRSVVSTPAEEEEAAGRALLLPQGAEGKRLPVSGLLTLEGSPLSGVALEARIDQDVRLGETFIEQIKTSPFYYSARGADLRQTLEEVEADLSIIDPTPDASQTTGKDGRFNLAVTHSETVTFSLDHDYYFFSGDRAGPYFWSESATAPVLDDFSGQLDTELGALIRGTVTDRLGLPIKEARIELSATRDNRGGMGGFPMGRMSGTGDGARVTMSDSQGDFVFRGVNPESDYTLRCGMDGFAPARSENLIPLPGQIHRVNFKLYEGAVLRVTVHDPQGAPQPGAEVFLHSAEEDARQGRGMRGFPMMGEPITGVCRTDAQGMADFPSLAAGRYTLKAYFPGFLQAESAGPISLTEEPGVVPVTLTLGAGLALAGRAVDDLGKPLAGVRVQARQGSEDRFDFRSRMGSLFLPESGLKQTETGEDGAFHLAGLSAENVYDLKAEKESYRSAEEEGLDSGAQGIVLILGRPGAVEGQAVRKQGGGPVTVFEVQLIPEAENEGEGQNRFFGGRGGNRGFNDSERGRRGGREGRRDDQRENRGSGERGGGDPVDTVFEKLGDSMRAIFSSPEEGSARTVACEDPEGRFRLEGIVPGRYRLCITATGFVPGVTDPFTVEMGETLRDQIIALEPGASISGETVCQAGVVAGAFLNVEARGDVDENLERILDRIEEVESDENGAFTLSGLPEGTFRVRARHADHPRVNTPYLSLVKGEAHTGMRVEFPPGARILGTAVDEQGLPLVGERVECQPEESRGGRDRTRTDSEGRFSFEELREGAYEVRLTSGRRGGFFAGNSEASSMSVDLLEGETCEILLKQEPLPGTRVQGVIRNQGVLLDQGFLLVADETGRGTRNAMINPDGSYRVDGVTPGLNRFTVRFNSGDRFESAVLSFDIPDLEEVWVDMELPGGSISGTVLSGLDGLPLKGARVILTQEGVNEPGGRGGPMGRFASGRKTAYTGEDGRFDFGLLAAATYQLEARLETSGGAEESYYPVILPGLVIAENQTRSELKCRLFPGGSMEVQVTDPQGEPLSGSTVSLRLEGESESTPGEKRERTDAEGTALLTGVEPGTYTLTVQNRQMAQVVTPGIPVSAGVLTRRDLTLEEGFSVSLSLTDAAGQAIEEASLILTNAQGTRLSLPSQRGGRGGRGGGESSYSLGSLAPAGYTVEVKWDGQTGRAGFTVSGPGEISLVIRP